jgi:hypothetical protein
MCLSVLSEHVALGKTCLFLSSEMEPYGVVCECRMYTASSRMSSEVDM